MQIKNGSFFGMSAHTLTYEIVKLDVLLKQHTDKSRGYLENFGSQ